MPELNDLTGRRFGRLTVLDRDRIDKKKTYWNCLCDCGKRSTVYSYSLLRGRTSSCGCSRLLNKFVDLTDRQFGKLTVIELRSLSGNKWIWICRCSCGQVRDVSHQNLLRGVTSNCGCIRVKDLTGCRFGQLSVVRREGSNKHRMATWVCICDCGKETVVVGHSLLNGDTKSCGCLWAPNLAGERYGMLLVISLKGTHRNKQMWTCQCDCGKETSASSSDLRYGKKSSCGCLKFNRHYNTRKPLKGRFSAYKQSAKNRGFPFDLSIGEFSELTNKECYYCGAPGPCNGLDRINSAGGYNASNCVSCCITCNTAKSNLPVGEFRSWIDRVYHHMHKEEENGNA